MNKNIIWVVMILVGFWACVPDVEDPTNTEVEVEVSTESSFLDNLNIPSNFNYVTTRDINLEVNVKGLTDLPLSGVKVSFYTKHPELNGKYLSSAVTNTDGNLRTELQVPSYLEEIFVQVHSAGFANQRTEFISSEMSLEFGGVPNQRTTNSQNRVNSEAIPISDNYYYMGTYNEGSWKGLPHYLEPEADVLSQDFLDAVNASLPENKPVPENNPQYLTSGNELDVVVLDTSDVWVTFVTEGAGYSNALGYYVFDTDNPPANPSEIDSIFVLLPNASLANAGGELNAGDKVRLGTFEGGKSISWVLFQNAWNGTGVNVNGTKFFSRSDFNTVESDPTKRQHTVQLADFGRELLLNGFEDQTRSASSDNDFNDLVFYVTANPWENIATGDIPQVTPDTDSDGDGISDESDDFPNDPTRAIRNTYRGALAFEDLWPAKGDYDFNDVVIDYEVDHILNGENLLVEIESDWTIKAVFASYHNGFGFELNTLPGNSITSVSGQNLNENIVSISSNGTETDQTNATVILFDNIFNVVQSSYPHISPTTTISSKIVMNTPVSQTETGFPPYNPFIFADGDREKEIHLPGKRPTSHANGQYFGSAFDATNYNNNYFYKTANGLPWAIHITDSFDFPKEGVPINEAYLNFVTWAMSSGSSNADWYLDQPNNRNESLIHN